MADQNWPEGFPGMPNEEQQQSQSMGTSWPALQGDYGSTTNGISHYSSQPLLDPSMNTPMSLPYGGFQQCK